MKRALIGRAAAFPRTCPIPPSGTNTVNTKKKERKKEKRKKNLEKPHRVEAPSRTTSNSLYWRYRKWVARILVFFSKTIVTRCFSFFFSKVLLAVKVGDSVKKHQRTLCDRDEKL